MKKQVTITESNGKQSQHEYATDQDALAVIKALRACGFRVYSVALSADGIVYGYDISNLEIVTAHYAIKTVY